jgi:hypothetical protein
MTVPIPTTNSSGDGTMVKDDEPLVITATVHCAVRHRRDCEGVQVNDEALFSIGFALGFTGAFSLVLCIGHVLLRDWLDGPTVGGK